MKKDTISADKPRLLELDALRGIAALGVVLFHYMVAFLSQYDNASEIFSGFRYFRYGKHGVELFFIISGFVIFMSLERTRNSRDFLFGRFSRLYPTYWAAIIFSFVIVTIAGFPDLRIDMKDALVNLTMLQGFLNVNHIDGNYWTLEIELSFYIIMLFLFNTKFLKRIDTVAIAWLGLISINSLLEKAQISLLDHRLKTFLILDYAHLFIIGMLLYKIFISGEFSIKKYVLIVLCLLFSLFKYGIEDALFSMLFTVVFILALRGKLTYIRWEPLLFLGTISYSLYLTHLYLGLITVKTLEKLGVNLNVCILISLVLALLLATLITFLIEKPSMKFMKSKYQNLKLKQS
jgi:peptidoglycan/LPS O-acetylase OafA/YrhL